MQTALESPRSKKLQHEVERLGRRDLQLWSVAVVVMLILSAGFLVVSLPSLIWADAGREFKPGHLVQLVIGLFVLIMIFTAFVLDQKRTQHRTREELVREIVYNERLQSFSLLDPLTQMFNRRYLDQVLPKEISRTNRAGSSLTFLLLDIGGWAKLRASQSELAADQLLIEAAELLRTTFRGSDTVLRYDDSKFLVIMPDTNTTQANCALRRLLARADEWNLESTSPFELVFNGGTAAYTRGADVANILRVLDGMVQEHTGFGTGSSAHSRLAEARMGAPATSIVQ